MPLLELKEQGLYCPAGDFYIDPWRPVSRAVVTHAHSDHARPGHGSYLSSGPSVPVLRHRLGREIRISGIPYGQSQNVRGVQVSFHPAGHVIGSAQVRVEYQGEVWVVSGDYKLEDDGISGAFEPVPCHHFVTESTFGLPVYRWRPQEEVYRQINNWWRQNREEGKTSLISAYSLGKAQRIICHLDRSIGTVYTHGAIEATNRMLREAGHSIPPAVYAAAEIPGKDFDGQLIIAPPSAIGSLWIRRFRKLVTASASGWMHIRGIRRRRGLDTGFVLSDHADWPGLLEAVRQTGAESIYITHGYSDIFARYLRQEGWNAVSLDTEYGTEEEEG